MIADEDSEAETDTSPFLNKFLMFSALTTRNDSVIDIN